MNRIAIALTLFGLVVSACTNNPEAEPKAKAAPTPEEAPEPEVIVPEWVMRGSWVDGRVMYAVGARSGIKNPALLRAATDNSARAEMMKMFEVFTVSMMKTYAVTGSPDGDGTSPEQMVGSVVKTFAAGTLNGVQIVDRWIHPKDGTSYSLARLDLDAFANSVRTSNDLSDAVKERVRLSAEKAMAEFAAEEERRAE